MGAVNVVTRNVVLTQHQHELVQAWVESGRYQNASEALRDGLRLLEREDEERSARLAAIQSAAQIGWSDVAEGRFVDVPEAELEGFTRRLGERVERRQSST